MQLITQEELERINKQLMFEYGREFNNEPRFRVVWSEDQYENRVAKFTPEGLELNYPEVVELPKYSYIKERYILERLVPVVGETDLVSNISYEPAWTFEDKHGNYLPPRYDACQFVIETLFSQIDSAGTFKKYKDPTDEDRAKKLKEVGDFLFGEETAVGDALAYGSGVVVPENKLAQKEQKEN